MGKFVLWICLMLAIFGGTMLLSQGLQPDVASDLALQQLEMSDEAAIKVRTVNAFLAWRGVVLCVSMVTITFCMFWRDVKGFFGTYV